MDALDSSSDSGEEEVEEEGPKKPKCTTITMEQLEKCGYKERPSILLVPEPKEKEDGIAQDW